jgi:hypothetical protein
MCTLSSLRVLRSCRTRRRLNATSKDASDLHLHSPEALVLTSVAATGATKTEKANTINIIC